MTPNMTDVYIALGSNLDEPMRQVRQAIETLKSLPNSQFVASSSLYFSKPMGVADQPDYVNAVVAIKTNLTPLELLDHTQNIEHQAGRVRNGERWGPRVLDLDIILYGSEQIDHERLTIPHAGLKVREFVLYPLMEISPHLTLPDGSKLTEIIHHIDRNGLVSLPYSE